MKPNALSALFFLAAGLFAAPNLAAGPVSEAEAKVIALFQGRGDRVTLDADGHAVKLFSGGKPELTVAELQSIGQLTHLEEIALNAAPGGDDDWAFLKQLPRLKKLTLWHGHHFSSLAPFCGLPVESVTFGGCMGLRDLNRDNPEKLRDPVLSLRDLPKLKLLTLYHSPLTPDDRHLAHIVKEFPGLTELRLDFAAPRGQEMSITASGLAELAKLKLTRLTIENADWFSAEMFAAIGDIGTLASLKIEPARGTPEVREASVKAYETLLEPVRKALPNLEVTYTEPFVAK